MNTFEKVNIVILLATITDFIAINSLLRGTEQIGPGMRWFITVRTSVGLFWLHIILVYWLIRVSDTLLAIYQQGRFLMDLPLRGRRGAAHGDLADLAGSLVDLDHGLRYRRERQD